MKSFYHKRYDDLVIAIKSFLTGNIEDEDLLAAISEPQAIIEAQATQPLTIAPDPEQLKQLSTLELIALRNRWYEQAAKSHLLDDCAHIAKHLGKEMDAHHGKYQFVDDESALMIYTDDYGGYMEVKVAGKHVVSTHRTDKFFIPGQWVNTVIALTPKAETVADAKEVDAEERERAAILKKLLVTD